MLKGSIFITGGSGFLGRAILRRAKKEKWPVRITCYSRDETKQWELKYKYPEVTCLLGDVSKDLPRLMAAMTGHDIVIHAGAIKFIDSAEYNVFETIETNIQGSINVAIAAKVAEVKTVVGISTDKAVSPANIYGMTKAVMERMYSEANNLGDTDFVTVRYGNVVGSTGSVIPLFKRQIEDDGVLKVTDSKMTRFWLSVDQAIDLILWSIDKAEEYPGYTFIPWCPAMKIVDLASAVWKMRYPEVVPNIAFTGIRPGEKMHESLFNEQEAPRITIDKKHGFLLAPAISKPLIPELYDYTSAHPKHWVSEDEMQNFILDSQDV